MATQTSPYTGQPIVEWFNDPYTLRDSDGDKVGDIVEINPDFIVAESDGGFLGLGERRTYYVPRGRLTSSEGSDWYLDIDKDQIEDMNWSSAPTDSTSSPAEWQLQDAYAPDAPREGAMRMVRYEEDLEPLKVQRQSGEVSVGKHVVEETRAIEVPVRREEVHVERRAVDGTTATETPDTAFNQDGESIRVPVMEEAVEVRKVVKPVEEIVVTKTATDDTRQVSGTVRKERFDITGDDQSVS